MSVQYKYENIRKNMNINEVELFETISRIIHKLNNDLEDPNNTGIFFVSINEL